MFRVFYNIFEGIVEYVIMSKKNLKSLTKSLSNPVKTSKLLPYRQPEMHFLGSLKKIQSGFSGSFIDGDNRPYSG